MLTRHQFVGLQKLRIGSLSPSSNSRVAVIALLLPIVVLSACSVAVGEGKDLNGPDPGVENRSSGFSGDAQSQPQSGSLPEPCRIDDVPGCAGVSPKASLEVHHGTITAEEPGTLIENLEVRDGCIEIRTSNVIVRNTRILSSVKCRGDSQVYMEMNRGVSNVLLENVEIDALGSPTGDGIFGSGFTCRRCDVHGVSGAVQFGRDVVIENSVLGGLCCDVPDGVHHATVATGGTGAGGRVVIRRNVIENNLRLSPSSALSLYANFSEVDDVLIEGNLFNGGAYCTYGGTTPARKLKASNVRYINNMFGSKYYRQCGIYGPIATFDPSGLGNRFEGNVWQDTGKTVELPD